MHRGQPLFIIDQERYALALNQAGAADYLIKQGQGDHLQLLPQVIDKALAHRALRAAQEAAELEYRTILRTAQDGFLMFDNATCIVDTNEAYCQMVGYTREEVLNLCIADIEAVEDAAEVARHVAEIQRQGYAKFESRHRHKDGRPVDVEVTVTPIPLRGGFMSASFARSACASARRTNWPSTARAWKTWSPNGLWTCPRPSRRPRWRIWPRAPSWPI